MAVRPVATPVTTRPGQALSLFRRFDTQDRAFARLDVRKLFLVLLGQIHPEATDELRQIPADKADETVADAAQHSLPHAGAGKWVPLAYLRLSSDLIEALERIRTTGGLRRLPRIPRALERAGWTRADLQGYLSEHPYVLVSPSVHAWATRWHIACNWTVAAATLARRRWRFRPQEPWIQTIATLPSLPLPQPLAAVGALAMPATDQSEAIRAEPLYETERRFLARAKDHYRQRVRRYRSASLAQDRTNPGIAARDCVWLLRVQVGGKSPAAVASSLGTTRHAVHRAVKRLADFIELPMRSLPKTGRRKGYRETDPRRRVTRK